MVRRVGRSPRAACLSKCTTTPQPTIAQQHMHRAATEDPYAPADMGFRSSSVPSARRRGEVDTNSSECTRLVCSTE
jgi:hypothetical protein